MSTLRRLRDALRGNLNDLMDRASQRGGGSASDLAALEEAAREVRSQVADLRARLAEIDRDAARAREVSQAAERAAMGALRTGDEPLARQHLARKLEQDAVAKDLEALASRERRYLEEVQEGQAALDARLAVARAEASFRAREVDEAAESWAQRVERLEAEAEALKEIWRDLREGGRARKPPPVEDELKHMKDQLDDKK